MSGNIGKSCLIENVRLLTPDEFGSFALAEKLASLMISNGRISAVSKDAASTHTLSTQVDFIVDGAGKIAMPGMINAHCHSYASVLRGTENSQPLEIWALHTMAYGRSLAPELIQIAVHLSAAEMIRNGITSVIDHIPHIGLLDHTLAGHVNCGMRVGVAPFMQDIPDHQFLGFDLPDELRAPLESSPPMTPTQTKSFFESFYERLADSPDRIIAMIGPNAPQRCSEAMWHTWRELQEKYSALVHTHLLETEAQAMQSHKIWSGGLVAEMERQGLLNANLSTAHNIWLEKAERKLLARRGVTVIHNPVSNLMLGSGVMPYNEYQRSGIEIGIGSDSANTAGRHDIFEGARLASMLPRLASKDYRTWPSTAEVLGRSIRAGAKALGLGRDLGALAPGQIADLVLLDMEGAMSVGLKLNAELVAQHGNRDLVTDVMVDGNWVMRKGELLTIDERGVLADFEEHREEFIARAVKQSDKLNRTEKFFRRKLLD